MINFTFCNLFRKMVLPEYTPSMQSNNNMPSISQGNGWLNELGTCSFIT